MPPAVSTTQIDAWAAGLPPPPADDARIAVLLSGGVDSALTAAVLQHAGYAVHAVTLRLADAFGAGGGEGADESLRARAVAERLGLPWVLFDLRDEFRARVLEPFVEAYRNGRTPSPCVGCNPTLKLGLAADRIAAHWGIRRLATGHYARIRRDASGRVRLGRAADPRRDQSYFLYRVPPERLARLTFPLGAALDKNQVREAARSLGLAPADHDDSMDLCFLPGGDYRELLPPPAADAPQGRIVDPEGRVVGRHAGCAYFTLGQRKGLGAHAGPRYVIALDPEENSVVIGPREAALRRIVHAAAPLYAEGGRPAPGARLRGRIRSGGEPRACTVLHADNEVLSVCFDEARFSPAPGQHLVLYDEGDDVVGGGEIEGSEA